MALLAIPATILILALATIAAQSTEGCWAGLPDVLRTYQTFAASILALLGVSATLLWNGYLARRERGAKIADDTEALRIALLTELKHFKNVLKWRIGELDRLASKAKADPLALPNVAFTTVYRDSISRLGLLRP